MSCCSVDAIISINGRGQIVPPKDLRRKLIYMRGINLQSSVGNLMERCVSSLIKADQFADTVKNMLNDDRANSKAIGKGGYNHEKGRNKEASTGRLW